MQYSGSSLLISSNNVMYVVMLYGSLVLLSRDYLFTTKYQIGKVSEYHVLYIHIRHEPNIS